MSPRSWPPCSTPISPAILPADRFVTSWIAAGATSSHVATRSQDLHRVGPRVPGTALAAHRGMSLERLASRYSLIDVLDRVLDKGLVIDASLRVSVAGIDIVGIDARVLVASIETYAKTRATSQPTLRRPAAVLTSSAVPRRRRRRRTVNARCEHGCSFVMRRDALPSTVTCPFDGDRTCSIAA